MPNRFQWIIDPIGAQRMRNRGYVPLPNGEWGSQEQYDRMRADIRQRAEVARQNAVPRDPRSFSRRFSDYINANVGPDFMQQVANNDSPFANLAADYAFSGLDAQHQYISLLMKSLLAGGIAGATSGNPLVGLGVGVTNAIKGLPGAIKKSFEDAQTPSTTTNDDILYYNENDFPKTFGQQEREKEEAQRTADFIVDGQTGDVTDNTGKYVTNVFTQNEPSSTPKRYDNLSMQRVESFTIPGVRKSRNVELRKGNKVSDRARRYSRYRFLLSDLV